MMKRLWSGGGSFDGFGRGVREGVWDLKIEFVVKRESCIDTNVFKQIIGVGRGRRKRDYGGCVKNVSHGGYK